MKVAKLVRYWGHVQGVGFRFTAQNLAQGYPIAGYVRNLPDGSVEAFAEGDSDAVTRLERAIRRGPAGARVRSVDVSDEPAGGAFKSFAIT